MTKLSVAALQARFTDDLRTDVARTVAQVEEAAGRGARVVLPPELFQGHYFCRTERDEHFARAHPLHAHPAVLAMQEVAERLNVVVPTSFFEKDGQHYYNSLAMIDGDGSVLGVYRKSHIPDGPGYEEKYYFRPGNSGFRVWDTRHGRVGVGVCWDQWFPEAARAMVGHAVSNLVPIVAANRTGTEGDQTFYGHSFVCDHFGDIVGELGSEEEGAIVVELDLAEAERWRAAFGFFRDRRPELYQRLTVDE